MFLDYWFITVCTEVIPNSEYETEYEIFFTQKRLYFSDVLSLFNKHKSDSSKDFAAVGFITWNGKNIGKFR